MIEVKKLGKTYLNGDVSTPVLKDISFHVGVGEYVAIMGTSGSGKTTLLNILGCLDSPTAGSYLVNGIEVAHLNDDELSRLRNRQIGFVFQLFNLLERVTLMDNVLLPLLYSEDYPVDAEERAKKILVSVGLEDRLRYRPNELSGGQQQRVAIARALVNDPSLILADEPTGNLDTQSGAEILAIFQSLNAEGRTIVMVTHDRVVAEHADRILQLEDGRIVEDRRVVHSAEATAGTSRKQSDESV
jgi:putative ABC transport system ATP-binding protein